VAKAGKKPYFNKTANPKLIGRIKYYQHNKVECDIMASKQKTPAERARTLSFLHRVEKGIGITLVSSSTLELAALAANKLIEHPIMPLTEKEFIMAATIGAGSFVLGVTGLVVAGVAKRRSESLLREENSRIVAERWLDRSKKDKDLYI